MYSKKGVTGLLRMGILVLLLASCISVAGASARVVHSCGTIYIGDNVDVTNCVSGTMIGYWTGPVEGAPSKKVAIFDKKSFYVYPGYFNGYTGVWYNLDASDKPTSIAFRVLDPAVQSCGTVYIGEKNLDITHCVSGNTIGYWFTSPEPGLAPSKTFVFKNKRSFFVNPYDFTGYTGTWYNYNSVTGAGDVAFDVAYSQPGMPSRVVPAGGDVALGETGIDITYCVSGTTIGWWAGPLEGAPTNIVTVKNKQSFFVDPTQFDGYTGNWYNYNSRTGEPGPLAFNVVV
jgi:hypothetical protein